MGQGKNEGWNFELQGKVEELIFYHLFFVNVLAPSLSLFFFFVNVVQAKLTTLKNYHNKVLLYKLYTLK